MSDQILHHAGLAGSHDSDEFSSAHPYAHHFDDVARETELGHELHGFVAGPLEAIAHAEDRHDMRLNQARALLMMIQDPEPREFFERLNSTLKDYYVQTIVQLVDAAYIDGKVAIKQARRGG